MHKISKFVPLAILIFCSVSIACKGDADPLVGGDSTPAPAKTSNSVNSKPPAGSSKAKFAGYEEAVKHYNLAVQLHQAGYYNKAIAEYKAAVHEYDGLEQAWANLATVYLTGQQYKAALEAIMRASAINPDRAMTLDYYGQILFALGRDEEALTKFQRAIDIEPGFKSSYYDMADVLRRTGHDDKAEELLKRLPKELVPPTLSQ